MKYILISILLMFALNMQLLAKTSDASISPEFTDNKFSGFIFDVVKPNSVYQKAGIQTGDKLVMINAKPVKKINQVIALQRGLSESKVFTLTIKREGKILSIQLGG